jgi:Spy/CpxP family protein refolding chaperone
MKDNLLKYVFILSLLLNFSFLGAAGYTHYQQSRYRTAPCGYGVQGRAPVYSSKHSHLFEALSLKPEQRKLFEQKAQLFHEALDQKGGKVDRLRRSLFDLIKADDPDSKAVETTIAEINGVQQEMQKMIVAHMLEFKSMLAKDQQKKFFDLIQGAMAGRQEIQCP